MSIPSSPERPLVAAAHYIPTSPLTSPPSVILSPSSIPDEPPHTAYDLPSPSPYFEDVGDAGGDPDNWESDGERTELSSAPRLPCSSRRVTPLTQQNKLNRMAQTLKSVRWTFTDFILAWAGFEEESQDIRVQHKSYGKVAARRTALSEAMNLLATRGICHESLIAVCANELSQLVELPLFARFNYTMDVERLNYAEAVQSIRSVAPTWYSFIRSVMANTRSSRPSYGGEDKRGAIDRRIYTVTSMVCFSRARQGSNVLASCLDLYLLGSGVHRRVIETLAGLGVCHSYHHANNLMNKLQTHAEVC